MSSKVRFYYKDRKEKQAELTPKTPELQKALMEKDNKDHVIVRSDDCLIIDVADMLLKIEILETERLSDERIEMMQEEIIALNEAKLLLKMFRAFSNSSDPTHQKLYKEIKNYLDAMKFLQVQGKREEGK